MLLSLKATPPVCPDRHGVMTDVDMAELADAIEEIFSVARSFGLDFFPMRYEVCPADIIYTFGAYAMPSRFSHWSFGKAFHQMKTQYDYGMSKIYELVINSDPCYAFLLDSNSLIQNKLIAAHVLGHCDFFKHNYRFANTNRQMVHTMAAFANRVQQYEQQYGRVRVEQFLDAVLAIHEHVDPFPKYEQRGRRSDTQPSTAMAPYEDLWSLDHRNEPIPSEETTHPNKSGQSRDLLQFLLAWGHDLEEWQRDIIASLRSEMLYFRPQMETKIMNEGWATYWHVRIMRALDLPADQSLEFARMHASVLAPSRMRLNPYHLGYHLFEAIEQQYGPERLFEVREIETDVSFLRSYLTKSLCEKLDLYLYAKQGNEWRITATGWEKVRDGMIRHLSNCGFPYIYAEEHDYKRRGELYLRHAYEGIELDVPYLKRTLPHLFHIWQRPIHLETVENDERVLYSYSGSEVERKVI